ncbi:MAG: hypothetical protein V4531_09355 [Actinomycetota bacterium]
MTTKTPSRWGANGTTRPRPLVILDIVVAILISLVGLIFMLALAGFYADQFVLPVFGILTKILAVVSWFAGTAMFILFEVRGRFAFYWPLIGIVAMFAFYYLVLFIASRVAA